MEVVRAPAWPQGWNDTPFLTDGALVAGNAALGLNMRPAIWQAGLAAWLDEPAPFCPSTWIVGGVAGSGIVASRINFLPPTGSCALEDQRACVTDLGRGTNQVLEPPVPWASSEAYDATNDGAVICMLRGQTDMEFAGALFADGAWSLLPAPTPGGHHAYAIEASDDNYLLGFAMGSLSPSSPHVYWDLHTGQVGWLHAVAGMSWAEAVCTGGWYAGRDVFTGRPLAWNVSGERRVFSSSQLTLVEGTAYGVSSDGMQAVGLATFLMYVPGHQDPPPLSRVFHARDSDVTLLDCDLPPDLPPTQQADTQMNAGGQIIARFVDGEYRLLTPLAQSIPSPDLDCSKSVDGADLSILLGSWGRSGTGDLDDSGSVDGADLAILLGAWDP